MADTVRARVRSLLDGVDEQANTPLPEAAALLLEALDGGGMIHAAGAGHSLIMVCETFYRAGGLAAIRPLWDPRVLPLSGALASTDAERSVGLGHAVVAKAAPRPPDVLVVFSTSGRNPYPVEIAEACQARDVPVIAVTSIAASAAAPARSSGTLAEHATIVLGTHVPAGDAVYPAAAPRTSAVSTVACGYLWALLLAELDDLAAARGSTLPRWTSANVPGGDTANRDLLGRYGDRIPELRAEHVDGA